MNYYDFKSGFNVSEWSTVRMFFLAPNEFGIRVFLDSSADILIREWRELFDTDNRDILKANQTRAKYVEQSIPNVVSMNNPF